MTTRPRSESALLSARKAGAWMPSSLVTRITIARSPSRLGRGRGCGRAVGSGRRPLPRLAARHEQEEPREESEKARQLLGGTEVASLIGVHGGDGHAADAIALASGADQDFGLEEKASRSLDRRN